MKSFLLFVFTLFSIRSYSQKINQTSFDTSLGQQILLKFDYPVVKVSTWNKNKVSILMHVLINGKEDNGAYNISHKLVDNKMVFTGELNDTYSIPFMHKAFHHGQVTPESTNSGKWYLGWKEKKKILISDFNIVAEIQIPINCVTSIESTYGLVEVKHFSGPLTITSIYGGIDVTLVTSEVGKLQATINYGEIFTDLDLRLTEHTQHDFFESISAEPGDGPEYIFTSTYGKIYLRKP